MSDLLTHWAVFDDARRLANCDSHVEPLFVDILNETDDIARLGALSRGGNWWTGQILRATRADQKPGEARWRQKIAYALGGLLHYPADYKYKPLMKRLVKEIEGANTREVYAYQDCHVFREVYGSGQDAPFSPHFLAPNSSETGRELERFVRALFQRSLLSSHTLAPDRQNFDEWLDNLLDKVQPLYIDVGLYVSVWSDPDPAKIAAYEVETTFYGKDDAIIRLARRIQNGESIEQSELDKVLAAPGASHYAECLQIGVRVLREATQFWRGETDQTPDVSQGAGKG